MFHMVKLGLDTSVRLTQFSAVWEVILSYVNWSVHATRMQLEREWYAMHFLPLHRPRSRVRPHHPVVSYLLWKSEVWCIIHYYSVVIWSCDPASRFIKQVFACSAGRHRCLISCGKCVDGTFGCATAAWCVVIALFKQSPEAIVWYIRAS